MSESLETNELREMRDSIASRMQALRELIGAVEVEHKLLKQVAGAMVVMGKSLCKFGSLEELCTHLRVDPTIENLRRVSRVLLDLGCTLKVVSLPTVISGIE